MKRKSIHYRSAIFFFFILIICCKKESSNLNDSKPVLLSIAQLGPPLSIPDAMNNSMNFYAKDAKSLIDSINVISRSFSYFNFPMDSDKSVFKTANNIWTWKTGEYNVRYMVNYVTDSVKINIYIAKGTETERLYAQAIENYDLSGGRMILNLTRTDAVKPIVRSYVWKKLSSSSMEYTEYTGWLWPKYIRITTNTDGSGTATRVDDTANEHTVSWVADGKSGSWSRYCGDYSPYNTSGTWTAK